MQIENGTCLRTIEQQFTEQLGKSGLAETDMNTAQEVLRSIIQPLVTECTDCPFNKSPDGGEGLDDQKRKALVESTVNDPELTHGLYGKFGSKPHYPNEGTYGIRKGTEVQLAQHWDPLRRIPSKTEAKFGCGQGWRDVLDEKPGGRPKFEALVIQKSWPESNEIGLSLVYFDNKSADDRGGINTVYTLLVPEKRTELIQSLHKDPSLMIDLMRASFPDADRSEGSLHLATDPLIIR